MKENALADLVGGWDGFEKLIADLHNTGDVEVEHNVILTGKSGTPRQIDVVVKHKQGYYEHLVIIECKYWNKPVERLHVDAFVTAVEDLNASQGVIFTTLGFQKGAIAAAEQYGIKLFTVREPDDAEWGLPGRVVDFFMQFIQRSVGNIQVHDVKATGMPSKPLKIELTLGDDVNCSNTPTIKKDGTAGKTLEEIIIKASSDALSRFTAEESFLLNK